MKKLVSITLAILTLAVLFSLTACFNAEGTYKFSQMQVKENGQTQTIKRGEEYGGERFDKDSAVMRVFTESGGKNSLNKLTFNAPFWFSEELTGEWEYLVINDSKEAVLNVNNNGLEIILAEAKDGKATVMIYANGIDYVLTLTK